MEDDVIFRKRVIEFSQRAYSSERYVFTDFLSISEVSMLISMYREIGQDSISMYGGTEVSERKVARFGNPKELGYEEEFPIACIKIEPLQQKYADELSHRDILGACMALGIERSNLGDIVINNNCGYLFCLDRMSDYIISNLDQVRHTNIKCSIVEGAPESAVNGQELMLQVHSERIDSVVAKLCEQSRSKAVELFRGKKVYVNGCQCENNSYILKQNDLISVRGFGRFRYLGVIKTTRKGNYLCRGIKYI